MLQQNRSCLGIDSVAQSIAKMKLSETQSPSTVITSSSSSCGIETKLQREAEEAKLKEEVENVKKELENIRAKAAAKDDQKEEVKTCLKTPFLIVIQGNTSTVDVVHTLDSPETIVGRDPETTDSTGSIFTDLGEKHCVIFRKQETVFLEDENFAARKRWRVKIGSMTSSAKIEVNNKKVDGDCELKNGDVITIDGRYVIMYKDPNLIETQVSAKKVVSSVQVKENEAAVTSQSKAEAVFVKSDLSFDFEKSYDVMKEVFAYFTEIDKAGMISSKVYPATVICMCVRHTAMNNTDACNDFILKVATSLNDVVTVS